MTSPVLILLDEMPPYFHYLDTQKVGNGTVADIATRAFANLLTAAGKKKNVCVVISDLAAAYDTGGALINRALKDARAELGRQERSITPVDLAANEIYDILRKRLFTAMPDKAEISDIASAYGRKLAEAAKAKTAHRGAEAIADEVAATYPFHPRLKNVVALFKENEQFKQTRGLIELVSRLLKSVWERTDNDVFLIGPQHFALSMSEVREKLTEISGMRDVIATDLWDAQRSAHAQVIDLEAGKDTAMQVGSLLLTASLSTAVNAVKGLTREEMVECLVSPLREPSEFLAAFEALDGAAWYLHRTPEDRFYFDRQENLTKLLQSPRQRRAGEPGRRPDPQPTERDVQGDAQDRLPGGPASAAARRGGRTSAPRPRSRDRESRLQDPTRGGAAFLRRAEPEEQPLCPHGRQDRDGQRGEGRPAALRRAEGRRPNPAGSSAARRAGAQAGRLGAGLQRHRSRPLRQGTLPDSASRKGARSSRPSPLDRTRDTTRQFDGEEQIEKTLVSHPLKLYLDVEKEFDSVRDKSEDLLWPENQDDTRWADAADRYAEQPGMPWLPPRALDLLKSIACNRGLWEDLDNGYITKKPRKKRTSAQVVAEPELGDEGRVRLRVNPVNAGPAPRIHYAEDSSVSESSPVLKENPWSTTALRVAFLVRDPSERYEAGDPVVWTNRLVLRNRLREEGGERRVELFVAPRGEIRYSLDGSEPRDGKPCDGPIAIGDDEVLLRAFATSEGLEAKEEFRFPAKGRKGVHIDETRPARLVSRSGYKLDSRTSTFEGLKQAGDKAVSFENVVLTAGQGARVAAITIGEVRVDAAFLTRLLENVLDKFPPDTPVTMTFRKAHFASGHDLRHFCETLGLDIAQGSVEQ